MRPEAMALCAALALFTPQLAPAQTITDPKTFAETAASSNMFEIESSELALQQTTSDAVRAFAQQMIDDHTAAGEKMKSAAETDGIAPPAGMMERHEAQLQGLQTAGSDTFEEAYVSAQVDAHDEAVELFEAFSENGEEGALRTFAAETLPALQEHQAKAHELAGAK